MLEVIVESGIGCLRLNRPSKSNALNADFWRDLPAAVAEFEARQDVRAIVM